jgi:uncharacterized membrane protein YfcA
MEPIWICYSFLSIFLAFFVKGLVGFGDPLIANPLLLVNYTSSIITPALAPISPIMNLSIILKNRKFFSSRFVIPISTFVMLGIIPGTFLLKYGSSNVLKLILGLLIIGLGIEMLTRKSAPNRKPNIIIQSMICFCSGFTAGLFGINLLFLAYMERVVTRREELRANACFVFFLENIFRVILYFIEGIYSKESLLLTAIGLPAAALAMKVGSLIDKKVSDSLSRKFIVYVFILGGISTTIFALFQLL